MTRPWYDPRRWLAALTPERPALPPVRAGYDSADRGPTMRDWRAVQTSADAEDFAPRALLRDRARDAERNIPMAARALRVLETKIVGKGCYSRSATGDAALDAKINALFDEFAKQAGVMNRMDWYGLQRLVTRSWLRDGECLARPRVRRASDGLRVPLQIELLEADHLDDTKNEDPITGTMNRIIQGVEYDAIGRVTAYWLWPRHPGDRTVALMTGQSVRVPAASVLHVYEPVRIGQSRGVTSFAPVLAAMRQHEKRRDAERVRARGEACVFATVSGDNPDGMAPDEGENGETVGSSGYIEDQHHNPVDRFQPGGIYNVSHGHELNLHAPAPSGGYDTAIRVEERTIASGLGLMYEHFGDLSQVNWASYRVGDVITREIVDAWRENVLEPMLVTPVWEAFIEACILAGELVPRAGGYPVVHRWPVHQEMDREAGAKADIAEMRSGATSLEMVCESKGRDMGEIIASHIRVQKAMEAAGLAFDGLPWLIAAGGTAQVVPASPPAP